MRDLLFRQSIVLERFVSHDLYGTGTYTEPVTTPAVVDYLIKNIKDFRGNEILTSAWIALPYGTEIGIEDRITMPDGTHPYIGSISPVYNYRTGETHYIEVYVSRQRPGEGSL